MSWRRILYALFICLVALVSALGGALAGGAAVYTAIKQGSNTGIGSLPTILPNAIETPVNNSITNPSNTGDQTETAVTRAVEKTGPAVVTVMGIIPGQATFFGTSPDETVSGSGVIISSEGYILTNNHVVDGTIKVSVILADGTEIQTAIVGTDLFSDLAVLKANGKMPTVAILGNSDVLKPGESVIAIGSPLGDFKNTVTVGVISATGRSLDTGNGYQLEDLIQTDAAINHGNSGGPLVNLNGEVIAINTLIVRGGLGSDIAEGLGFAIPANTIRAVTEQIIQKGYVSRPYLGVHSQSINPNIASFYNLPVEWGEYVTQVDNDSPADEAGIQRGDILTKLGGVTLDDNHPYVNALFTHTPNETITVEFVRGRKTIQVQITLSEMQK